MCLIVDNPDRDLDGMVLLAATLAQRGAETFLVPMYNQRLEVEALDPDFVLMNYARAANCAAMRAYSSRGIAIGVLDTEGGVWESEVMFVQSANREAMEKYVDLYCLWGERQRRAFLAHTDYPPEKFVVTGHPRYDFYAEPWVRAIAPARAGSGRAQVLLIANFVLAYPKYARSIEAEMRNMKESGFDQATLDDRLDADRRARTELLLATERLAADFGDVDWVLRPHPFEDDAEYVRRFAGARNVFVRPDLTVAPWIRGSVAVIHPNSSVAVDAYLLGAFQVCIDWIDNPVLRQWANMVTWKVSQKAESYAQLRLLVGQALDGRPPPRIDSVATREIRDWFHINDGRASMRVADAVLRLVSKARRRTATVSRSRDLKSYVDLAGGIAFGTRTYGYMRSAARSMLVNRKLVLARAALKDLDMARVRTRLQDLRPLGANGVLADRLRNGTLFERRLSQNSIRIAGQGRLLD